MKRTTRKAAAFAAALVLMVSLMIPMAGAVVDASDYFAMTDPVVIPVDGAKLVIEAESLATETMAEIGVKEIVLYERQSDGTYDDVKTWTRYNTSGMIAKDNVTHFKSVTYQGTIGNKYYAAISFYAKNYSGLSETLIFQTEIVTAVATVP